MAQYCPNCGAELVYYYQNQSWYCHRCQRYVGAYNQPNYQVQQPFVQPNQAYYPVPASVPDVGAAQSKIYGAMRMRDTTDQIIPISWAIIMVFLQILVPIVTVVMLYFWLVNGTLNLSLGSSMAVVVAVFLADIAMVIFQSVLIYRLVKRRDGHFRRDRQLRQGMMEFLDALAIERRKNIDVERWTMNSMHYSVADADRGPMLWALLAGLMTIIPVIGLIALLYCLYFLTGDVQTHDRRQRDFNYQFQLGMLKMGKINAISYDWQPLPRRDTAAYVLLVIFTLGFALPYWWYVNIRDMNTHLQNQWNFESQLITMTKQEVKDEIPAKPQL